MFDRDKDLNWKKFKDMTFYAAMGTAGGGRNEVDPRFISMFSTYNIVFPNDESLIQIYSSIFKGHLNYTKFQQRFMMIADIIVVMTLKLFKVCNSIRAFSIILLCLQKFFTMRNFFVGIYRNLKGWWKKKEIYRVVNAALKSLTNFLKFDLHMQITSIFHNLLCCLVAIQWKLFNGL